MMLRLQLERMDGRFRSRHRVSITASSASTDEKLALCQARCACHAPRPDEPWCRNRLRSRRRRAVRHPANRSKWASPSAWPCLMPWPATCPVEETPKAMPSRHRTYAADTTRRAHLLTPDWWTRSQKLDTTGGISHRRRPHRRLWPVKVDAKERRLGSGQAGDRLQGKAAVPRPHSTCAPLPANRATNTVKRLPQPPDAAAAGGVTTMIVMPNTDPVIDDVAIVDFILRRARDTAKVSASPPWQRSPKDWQRSGNDRVRHVAGCRRCRRDRWQPGCHQCPDSFAARIVLCPRLWSFWLSSMPKNPQWPPVS